MARDLVAAGSRTTVWDGSPTAGAVTSVMSTQLAVFPHAAAAPARTLISIFQNTAARCPDAPALDDGLACLDYRALEAEASSLAARLHGAGIGVGDRVGVRVPSGTAELSWCGPKRACARCLAPGWR
jgi:non-ribosomal peptide synthetase component F